MQMSSLRHEHLLRLVGICLHEEGIQLVSYDGYEITDTGERHAYSVAGHPSSASWKSAELPEEAQGSSLRKRSSSLLLPNIFGRWSGYCFWSRSYPMPVTVSLAEAGPPSCLTCFDVLTNLLIRVRSSHSSTEPVIPELSVERVEKLPDFWLVFNSPEAQESSKEKENKLLNNKSTFPTSRKCKGWMKEYCRMKNCC